MHVGDRSGRRFSSDRPARHLLAEDVRHGAAQRIVNAAGGAGGDRELLDLRDRGTCESACQSERAGRAAQCDKLPSIHVDFLQRTLPVIPVVAEETTALTTRQQSL